VEAAVLHGDLLGERARLTPDVTALVTVPGGQRFTYAELDRRAAVCARVFLEPLGLRNGDRCALAAGNRVAFLDVFFAAGKSGVVVVPINTHLTAHEVGPILRDAGCRAVVYGAECADLVRTLHATDLPVEHWLALDTPLLPGHSSYADLVSSLSSLPSPLSPASPDDIYCLLYTSGTTGRPKGVVIPHRMVSWNGYNTVVSWQLRADDVSPVFTPLYHAGGLGAFLLPIFTAGGIIVLHDRFDAVEVLHTIARERCTVILVVPTIAQMLAEAPEFNEVDLSHVRFFISGGAPLPPALVDVYRRRGFVLRQGYGLTEVGVNCFAMTDEDAWRKTGSVGKPLAFTEVRVVDDGNREVPAGEVGELCFRGPHVCAGYWNNPEATAAAFDGDGFFHTGDLARRDEEGFLFIAGRSKDMFISGGVNVYPAEVEMELGQHPAVADVAVVGVDDEKWGEIGVAFVVRRPGHEVTAEDLAEHLRARIARYKVPRDFVFVDALPRTAYGKVVKGDLRAAYVPSHPPGVGGRGSGVGEER
jgi:fatty-acyl-CoA synthase